MDFRVVRKYFYQRWRGYNSRNINRREIVFLLLGAPSYTLSFGTLLRLTFIRIGRVLEDTNIISVFSDEEISFFVKFAITISGQDRLYDLNLEEVIDSSGVDFSKVNVYLDLHKIFQEIGIDLISSGPDPLSSAEAFALKLLWPDYMENDEKYLAIMICGILATRFEKSNESMPLYSMHLTEVGMHLKSLEAIDASLAWSLPVLKTDGLRLARFLAKEPFSRYFIISESPCHHSDKVVTLNSSAIWKDAGDSWSFHELMPYVTDIVGLSDDISSFSSSSLNSMSADDNCFESYSERLAMTCAEQAISEEMVNDMMDSREEGDKEKEENGESQKEGGGGIYDDIENSILKDITEMDENSQNKILKINERNLNTIIKEEKYLPPHRLSRDNNSLTMDEALVALTAATRAMENLHMASLGSNCRVPFAEIAPAAQIKRPFISAQSHNRRPLSVAAVPFCPKGATIGLNSISSSEEYKSENENMSVLELLGENFAKSNAFVNPHIIHPFDSETSKIIEMVVNTKNSVSQISAWSF